MTMQKSPKAEEHDVGDDGPRGQMLHEHVSEAQCAADQYNTPWHDVAHVGTISRGGSSASGGRLVGTLESELEGVPFQALLPDGDWFLVPVAEGAWGRSVSWKRGSGAGSPELGPQAHAMESTPPLQRTGFGVLALVLCPVPVIGLVVAILICHRCAEETNAHTCAEVAFALAMFFTVLFSVLALFLLVMWPSGGLTMD